MVGDDGPFVSMTPGLPTVETMSVAGLPVPVVQQQGPTGLMGLMPRLYDVRIKLCNVALWKRFHALTNEMIITKGGR